MPEQIEFARHELAAALALVGKVRPWQRDSRAPSLIMIDAKGGAAAITSGNLDISISTEIPCGPGEATMFLPLASLTGAVEKSPDGSRVTLEANGAETVFRAGRFRSRVSGIVEDFAPIRAAVDGDQHPFQAAALKAGLCAAAPAAIEDAKRPFLGGVYLHDTPAGATLVAMDGNRIHAATEDGNRIHAATILPEALADLLAAVLPSDGEVSIVIGSRAVEVSFGNTLISSSIIDGQFPAYAEQLHVATDRTLRAPADKLLADFDLVATVADKDRDIRLDLGATNSVSAFRRVGNGFQSGTVELDAQFEGQPMAIGFQMKLVSDALSLFGNAVVEWRMGGPTDPTVITSDSRPGVEAMISPFLLKADHHYREAA